MSKTNAIQAGDGFGKWTVLAVLPRAINERQMILCKCECGTEKAVEAWNLIKGLTTRCEACRTRLNVAARERHGSLVVLDIVPGKPTRMALVQCDCGRTKLVPPRAWRDGRHSSCGHEDCRPVGPQLGNWTGAGQVPGRMLAAIRLRAKAKGRAFALTAEYVWSLFVEQDGKCALTGEPIWFGGQRHGVQRRSTASLDRIDSSLGYTEGNVRWTHKAVNKMKLDMPDDEYLAWCEKVAKHARENRKQAAPVEHPALFASAPPGDAK